MLFLIGATDKLQLVTGSAATVDVVASYADASMAAPPVVQGDTFGTTPTAITTATTTDIVPAPAAGEMRKIKSLYIRNKHATTSTDVTVVLDRSGTDYELHEASLDPGETLEYEEGIGFFELASSTPVPLGTNFANTASAAGFATDTYIANSALDLDALGAPRVGRCYHWRFIVSKTAAGIAAPVLTVRVGTAGTTADTARLTFTWGAGTAAADRGEIELDCLFTSVGSGTSAVLRGKANFTTNLATTGLSNAVKSLQVTSGGFASTVANSVIGLSWNGGTSAAHTIEYVAGYTDDF